MNKQKISKVILKTVLFLFFALVFSGMGVKTSVAAAKPKISPVPALEISGWIPYWRKATGAAEALNHLDTFKEINPFGYTVKQDGTLFDAMKINEEPWLSLIQAARLKKVRVMPSAFFGGATPPRSKVKLILRKNWE